jgi:hypothetical protein
MKAFCLVWFGLEASIRVSSVQTDNVRKDTTTIVAILLNRKCSFMCLIIVI